MSFGDCCSECAQLVREADKMRASGIEMRHCVGGHGYVSCRKYKGRWFGVECCWCHRKRMTKVLAYTQRMEEENEDNG